MNVKIVHGDDWEALYVNDLLYREDHKIEPSDICRAIINFDAQREFSYDEVWRNPIDEDNGYPVHYEDLKYGD